MRLTGTLAVVILGLSPDHFMRNVLIITLQLELLMCLCISLAGYLFNFSNVFLFRNVYFYSLLSVYSGIPSKMYTKQ